MTGRAGCFNSLPPPGRQGNDIDRAKEAAIGYFDAVADYYDKKAESPYTSDWMSQDYGASADVFRFLGERLSDEGFSASDCWYMYRAFKDRVGFRAAETLENNVSPGWAARFPAGSYMGQINSLGKLDLGSGYKLRDVDLQSLQEKVLDKWEPGREKPWALRAIEEKVCRDLRDRQEYEKLAGGIGMEKEHATDVPFDMAQDKKPILTLEEADRDWKSWANIRRQTLGDKDAAALMGYAPWRTREELLAEKKQFVSFTPDKTTEKGAKEAERMQRGLELQDRVKERFCEVTGIGLMEGAIYRSEEHPIMVSRVSMVSDRDGSPVILTTVGKENMHMWQGKDGKASSIPMNVVCEAQWKMAVTGKDKVHVGCLVDEQGMTDIEKQASPGFVQTIVKRDEKFIESMVKAAEGFRKDMESDFVRVFGISKDLVEKQGKTYKVKMPEKSSMEGAAVIIPERMMRETRDGYQLNLPIKNMNGRSFLFRKEMPGQETGKSASASAGEIFCAVNKVRGRMLFANNRKSLKQYWDKRKAQTNQAQAERTS